MQNTGRAGKETAVKVYHVEKMLQLLNVLRGEGKHQPWRCLWRLGPNLPAEIICPKISKVGMAKLHFFKLMAGLAAKAEKSGSK